MPVDERALLSIEPSFRIRHRKLTRIIRPIVLLDTSGSMFAPITVNVYGTTKTVLGTHVVMSALVEILKTIGRYGEVDGYLGFFSDQTSEFAYGGSFCPPPPPGVEYPGGSYYLLKGNVMSCAFELARRGSITVKTVTGGTNPDPLLQYLLQLLPRPNIIYILTDGYWFGSIDAKGNKVVVMLTPDGNDEQKVQKMVHNASSLEIVRIRLLTTKR